MLPGTELVNAPLKIFFKTMSSKKLMHSLLSFSSFFLPMLFVVLCVVFFFHFLISFNYEEQRCISGRTRRIWAVLKKLVPHPSSRTVAGRKAVLLV